MKIQNLSDAPIFQRAYGQLVLLCGNTDELMSSHQVDLKKIVVRPGERTSHHLHLERDSIFHFLEGKGTISSRMTGESLEVDEDVTVLVSPGEDHVIVNTGTSELLFFESESPAHSSLDKVLVDEPAHVTERIPLGRFWEAADLRCRIKICGVKNIETVLECSRLGVDCVGVHSIGAEGIRNCLRNSDFLEYVPRDISVFLLVDTSNVAVIGNLTTRLMFDTLQLQGEHSHSEIRTLSELLHNSGRKLVRTVSAVKGRSYEELYEEAKALSDCVDAILLDAGSYGGTGRVHDWQLSEKLHVDVDCPIIIAGGLNVRNVAEAVKAIRPYGVDVETGVETYLEGWSNKKKKVKSFSAIKQFVSAVRGIQ